MSKISDFLLQNLCRESKNSNSLKSILEKEKIINIVTGKLTSKSGNANQLKANGEQSVSQGYNQSMNIFWITDYATLISFKYCFQKSEVNVNRQGSLIKPQESTRFQKLKENKIRNLSISDHLKQMTGFKISKVIASKYYPICMLIEQDMVK